MATLKSQLTGGDAEKFYDDMFVRRGLVREEKTLPDAQKNKKGFYLSKWFQRTSRNSPIGKTVVLEEGQYKTADGNDVRLTGGGSLYEQVEEPTDIRGREFDDPKQEDDYGVVRVHRDPLKGWAKHLYHKFGTPNPFLSELSLATMGENPVSKTASRIKQNGARTATERFVKHDIEEKQTGLIDAGVVQSSTPILIDPEVFDTVRQAAPILDVVPTVAQAGYTASYNLISARDSVHANSSLGMQGEDEVDDLSGVAGQGMTLQNVDQDMKIFVDLVNISDFSRRAQSSLGFMDLEGTTMEARLNEYATFKAKQFFYGDPDQSESNGSVEDSNAYDGMREFSEETSNDTDKSSVSLSGDKALFEDIKGEIVDLVQNQNVTTNDLHIACSPQTFEALENEAHINVRLDAFDEGVNFGGMTLSIMGVPITADPNIQSYSGLTGASNIGDVFLFDTRAIQFRALAPLFTLPLGRLGLADRTALAEYGALIDKSFDSGSNTSHTRYLKNYSVP